MTGVVLRCPNCGTTKAGPGECDACHEAQVRYYCTNHTPGQWLERAACPQCGARFGEAVRAPSPPRPAARPRPPAPAPPPTSTPPTTRSRSWLPDGGRSPWARRKRRVGDEAGLDASEVSGAPDRVLAARLREIIEAAARARRTPWGHAPMPDSPRIVLGLGGCLIRGLFLAMFLLFAFLMMSLIVGGSLLQMLGAYY
jgi:hypothetical protein